MNGPSVSAASITDGGQSFERLTPRAISKETGDHARKRLERVLLFGQHGHHGGHAVHVFGLIGYPAKKVEEEMLRNVRDGFDAANLEDRSRFRTTEKGLMLITPEMLGQRVHQVR